MRRRIPLSAIPTAVYVLVFMITILNAAFWMFFRDAEYVVYPLLLGSTQQVIWQISLILIVVGGFSYFIFRPAVSLKVHLGRGFLVLMGLVVLSVVVHKAVSEPVSTTSLNGSVYHLSRNRFNGGILGTVRYVGMEGEHELYECDVSGIICREIYEKRLVWSGAEIPLGTQEFKIESANWQPIPITLEADPATNTVSILSDGRVVYTYQVDE